MDILLWIVLGLVAGFLASMVMKGGYGLIGDIIIGVVGALLGGWLFSLLGAGGVSGFNLWSIFVAFVGACVLIALLRLLSGRRAY